MSKFRTKKIVEINEAARGTYDTNSQIKFITPLLTLKRLGSGGSGGVNLRSSVVFQKNYILE